MQVKVQGPVKSYNRCGPLDQEKNSQFRLTWGGATVTCGHCVSGGRTPPPEGCSLPAPWGGTLSHGHWSVPMPPHSESLCWWNLLRVKKNWWNFVTAFLHYFFTIYCKICLNLKLFGMRVNLNLWTNGSDIKETILWIREFTIMSFLKYFKID